MSKKDSISDFNKNLFVTFPVDLGNITLEANLNELFQNDFDFFRFAEDHATKRKQKITLWKSVYFRLKSTFDLRRRVYEKSKNGGYLIFQNLSPALFSYGTWNGNKSIIILDWTRTLYSQVYEVEIKKDLIFYFHKKILNKCHKIFCWTDAAINNIHHVYGIDLKKIYKVPAPFIIKKLNIFPRLTPPKPRVLFIGGDWFRKGGDILINAWEEKLKYNCELTILTSDKTLQINGAIINTNINYGTLEHRQIFQSNDILILPARFDAYPQVIGEAAASGLAVITTKYALGSPEIIVHGKTGYIASTPEESIEYLIDILNNKSKIDSFKMEGYNLMQKNFAEEVIRSKYINLIKS